MEKPNVLLIYTCQHSGDAMSCAGAEHLETPALDRLAAEGVLFRNAYTPQPLCQPARVSMMTGQTPHKLGMTRNGKVSEIDAKYPIGKVLSDQGYDTAMMGKLHMVPNAYAGLDVKKGIGRNDGKISREGLKFINKDRDNPFFLIASYNRTHDACDLARKLGNHPSGTNLAQGELGPFPKVDQLPPVPENFPIPYREPEVLREIVHPAHESAYPMTEQGMTAWRKYRWGYNRLVEEQDHHIGHLLNRLRATNQLENTLVIVTGGHGDGMGSHRWTQKQVLYEEPIKIPFIVRPPGGMDGRVDDESLVSGLDLVPTIMEYVGVEVPDALPGQSVKPLVENPDQAEGHDYVVTETTFGTGNGDFGVHGRMIRTDRYKYIVYNKGAHREQLFDLKKDPGEMVNLAGLDEHRDVLNRHRKLLRQWISKTNDDFDHVPAPQ